MKSKHLLLLMLLAVFAPWAANAQTETVTIGTGTSTDYYTPIGTYHNYSFSEQLYTATDINKTGYILSIGFSYAGTTAKDFPVVVYMKAVDDTNLSSGWISVAETDEVFNGTLSVTGSGWATIVLDEPFNYDGTKNLLIAIDKAYVKWYSGGNWNHTSATSMVRYYCNDTNDPDPMNPSSAGTSTVTSNRPNVQLTFGTPATCPKPTLLEVAEEDIEANAATIHWTASNEDQQYFDIYWSTTNTAPDENTTPLAANQQGNSYQITGLSAATQYYVWIRGNCGTPQDPDISGGWTAAKSFMTACDAISPGYTCGFEGPNTGGTPSYPLPVCWTRITGQSSTLYPYVYSYSSPHTDSYHLYFYSSSNASATEIAILPEISEGVNGKRLSFYQKGAYSFSVGYMTNFEDESTFVPVFTQTGTSSYAPYDVDFSECPNDAKFIAIKSNFTSTYQGMFFDDLALSLTPSCLDPTMNATATNIGTHAATVSWTAGGTNQLHWDVYYNKTGVAPTDETTPQVVYTDQNPLEITGLDASSTYYVWVRGNCGTQADPDYSSWSATYCQFDTQCEANTTFPWSENFESHASGDFSAPCWMNERIQDGTGSSGYLYIFQINTSSQGGNTTHQLKLPDMKAGTITELRLPEMTLPSNNYQFVIDVYRDNNSKENEGIKILASANGAVEGATELGYIQHYFNYAPKETAIGWYTYEFPISFSGTCYIIILGYSQYGTATYMDNFSIEEIPTCARPSGLACNSKTAHTATFSWTNGAEGQSAWQIAYSTEDDFDPASVTPVDVTSNPATVSGLNAYTLYTAYVRANCGNGDYSPWCRKPVEFMTVTGTAVPTGLAVNEATITSSQATASWTGVATNDYHQSYDIYWATSDVTSVPAEPAAPNLISGITETSQVISSLDENTNYKVWVRDYCGADGYSNWSSAVTFHTAEACQTPDGLAESEVTTNSAKITWNTYGLTDFNLRYGTDGENWTTVTENVATPYTLSLSANTYYYVQVQAKCNTEEWSETLNFRTECEAMTITATNYINEGFEDYEGTTYNSAGVVPYCWDNYTTATYPAPHVVSSGSYVYVHNGSNSLNFECSANSSAYLALPELTNDLNTLMVNFWMRTEGTSTTYKLSLGYITAEDVNYNTYQIIEEYDNTTTVTERTTYLGLKNVPATAARLVFRWTNTGSSYYACCIDDVVVKLAPTCYPVGTLSYADVASHTVKLSWGLIDNSQDSWEVQYATNADFTEGVGTDNASTNANFVLGGLAAETHYYVRVRGNCGNNDYGEWSNSVNFTTDIACPAPTMQAATGVSNNQATLSWTGSEASSFNVRYKTTNKEDWVTPENSPVDESTITITGLEAETEYEAQVQAVCGGEDGESLWSTSVTFTTLSNCAAPDGLNVTELTDNSATLNWNGVQDNYNVRYREVITPGVNFNETYDFEDGTLQGWTSYDEDGDGNGWTNVSTAHGGTRGLQGMYNLNDVPENWLISPEIPLGGTLSFYAKRYSSGNGEQFQVLVSTTGTDISNFTAITDVIDATASWELYEYSLSNYSGNGYVAIKHTAEENQWYLYVDDITITNTTPGEYGAWNTDNTDVTSGLPISGLEMNTKYEWQVQGINASCDGGVTDWSEAATFTTPITKPITGYGEGDGNWYLIASPLADDVDPTTVGMITDELGETATSETSTYDLYRFDQTQSDEWLNYRKTSFNLANGTGYLYANKNDVALTFAGLPYEGNSKVVTLSNDPGENTTTHLAGYNLVGNPFTVNAYIGDRDFYVMNNGTEIILADRVAEGAAEYIEPMEGIFVIATENNEQLTFTTTAPESKGASLALNVNKNRGVVDRAMVRFGEGRTLPKFQLRNNSTKVYIPQDNIDYAVVSAEAMGELPVNFRANENGSYTLSFTSEEVSFSYLHLIDNMTGNDVDLLQTPSYTFDALTTDYESRFKLVFATGNAADDSFAFYSNGNWIINNDGQATLQVIDVTGRILSSETVNGSVSTTINAAPGVYMLRLVNGDNVKVQKVVVR